MTINNRTIPSLVSNMPNNSKLKRLCVDSRRIGYLPEDNDVKFCLMSMAPYDGFQFSLGADIVTAVLRDTDGIYCDHAVWMNTQFADILKQCTGYYSGNSMRDFDIVGMSLYYVNSYYYIVPAMLRMGVHPLAAERSEKDPIICAGGGCMTTNPEPVADFFDFIFVGDAEGILPKVLLDYDKSRMSKREYLQHLYDTYDCIYVPSLPMRTVTANRAKVEEIRLLAASDSTSKYWRKQIELIRGCKYSCRFCNLSWTRGSARYLPAERVIEAICTYPDDSGVQIYPFAPDESTYDKYEQIESVLGQRKLYRYNQRINTYYKRLSSNKHDSNVALSTARIVHGIDGMSERCRKFIHKQVTDQQIRHVLLHDLNHVREIKLNTIFAMPYESDSDVVEWENLIRWACEERLKISGAALTGDYLKKWRGGRHDAVKMFKEDVCGDKLVMLNIAATPFQPEPQTPMQWYDMPYSNRHRERFVSMMEKIKRDYCMVKYEGLNSVDNHRASLILKRGDRSYSKYLLQCAIVRGRISEAIKHSKLINAVSKDHSVQELIGRISVDSALPWEFVNTNNGRKSLRDVFNTMEKEAQKLFELKQ